MQYPNDSMDAFSQKIKNKTKKQKVPLRCFSRTSNNTSTTMTTPKLQKSDASKKETVHKRRHRPVKRL
jgi:hypothetical protein